MRVRPLFAVFCALLVWLTAGVLGASPAVGIAQGVAAEEGQFPFAVQLRLYNITRSDGTTYDSACSGALIAPSWVITAGHCFHDGNRTRVSGEPRYAATARLGTASTVDPAAGVSRTIVWVEQSSTNDIAVVKLDAPVDGISPIALSSTAPNRGQVLSFAGWGATSSSGTWSDQLHWGQVKVSRVRPVTALVKGHWPYQDTSACPYDSGAPYFTTTSPPVLVSIEKDGPACPHKSEETTSRVDVVGNWIRTTTGLT